MQPIYLDYNATTPVEPNVLKAMLPYLHKEFGNPSSAHSLGRRAHEAVEWARSEVATLIGAFPDEIIFTGGGTEASNMAIRGAAALNPRRKTVVTTNIEHPATDACCKLLESNAHPVRRVAAQADGRVDPAAMKKAIRKDTALVSVIHAQNEIGTLQPVAEIAQLARSAGALSMLMLPNHSERCRCASMSLASIFFRSLAISSTRRKVSAPFTSVAA